MANKQPIRGAVTGATSQVGCALLVGSVPRKQGMERRGLLGFSGKIFVGQGKANAENAAKDARVPVVGAPCNTDSLIAMRHAVNVPEDRFFAMPRLDENRAKTLFTFEAGAHESTLPEITGELSALEKTTKQH